MCRGHLHKRKTTRSGEEGEQKLTIPEPCNQCNNERQQEVWIKTVKLQRNVCLFGVPNKNYSLTFYDLIVKNVTMEKSILPHSFQMLM